jgi:hypothetical protein
MCPARCISLSRHCRPEACVYGAVATAIGQGRFRLVGEAPQSLAALARSGGDGLLTGYGGLLAAALLGFASSLRLSGGFGNVAAGRAAGAG